MVKYKISLSLSAEKKLKKLPKKDVSKIVVAIQSLALDPYPEGCRKLSGEENTYRIRQGLYRIIYEVHKNKLVILVLKLGHRKDIYKR